MQIRTNEIFHQNINILFSADKPKPYKIIRVVQEKGSTPSAQLISAKGIDLDPKSEEAESW